jgi:hypothetical protein
MYEAKWTGTGSHMLPRQLFAANNTLKLTLSGHEREAGDAEARHEP